MSPSASPLTTSFAHRPLNDYQFKVSCDVGQVVDDRWTFTATDADVGNHPFKVSVYGENNERLETASSVLAVMPTDAGISGKPFRLLIIGDSLTHASAYPNEIARLLSGEGNPPWKMLGTHKPPSATKNVAHEGYGGWTWHSFVTKNEPNPENDSKKHTSPFLFPHQDGQHQLDMARYFDQHCGGERPDYVVILLGINDCFTAPVDDPTVKIDTMFRYADQLLESLHTAAPQAKIGMCLTTPPNARQEAFEANYEDRYSRWGWKQIQHQLVQRQIEYIKSIQDMPISMVPTQLSIDPVDGYPVNNGVHPNKLGYQQIGSSIYAWLKWQLAKPVSN